MQNLEQLRQALPVAANDLKLNLQATLQSETLTLEQRWGVALSAAFTLGVDDLTAALLDQAKHELPPALAPAVVEDAYAAASLMAMNNVYYRFGHLVGKASYRDKPARLRMNRIVKTKAAKADFELYSLVASALNNCEACVKAHEDAVVRAGIGESAVQDAIRLAATLAGLGTAWPQRKWLLEDSTV